MAFYCMRHKRSRLVHGQILCFFSWEDATKFLTGASAMGSVAIPVILKHAGVITWGAFAMEISSLFVFVMAILCLTGMNSDDGGYRMI
ncbi:hypothetical protein HanPI659440_Chr16g0635071 [Helianthus annuus]|nr:hypothetical protein HanPI659440_Chr16g0635071 [Helianthus annuus]